MDPTNPLGGPRAAGSGRANKDPYEARTEKNQKITTRKHEKVVQHGRTVAHPMTEERR